MTTAALERPSPGPAGGASAVAAVPADGRLPRSTTIMILAGGLPLLAVAVILTWRHPAYRFFPLAWLGALWLMWRGWRELTSDLVPGTRTGAAVLLGLAWLLALVSTVAWSAWGGAIGALLCVVGLTWWAGGWLAVRAFLPGLLVIALAVPPPLGLDERFFGWLGAKSVSAVSRLLHSLSVTHFVGGQALEVPGLSLPLVSLTVLLNAMPGLAAFAVFYAAMLRRATWRGVLMVPFASVFALAAAILTMVYAVRASAAYKMDLLAGSRGWLLLVAVVVVAGLLVASLDQLLQFLLSPVTSAEEEAREQVDRGGPGPRLTAAIPAKGLGRWSAWGFLALGLAQVPLAGLCLWHEFAAPIPLVSRLPAVARFELPLTSGWKAVANAPLYLPLPQTNATTRGVWVCESGNLAAALVLDCPVAPDADAVCDYAQLGWRIAERRLHRGNPKAPAPWTDGLMQKDRGQVAGFWFATMDESGRWVGPPPEDFSLLTPFRPPMRKAPTMRVFLLAVAKDTMTAADREKLESLLLSARAVLGKQFLSQLAPP